MRARRAALDVLDAVRRRDAYANLVLPVVLARHQLTGSDAARATELAYGTLRALGTLDRVIAACSSRPLDRVDPTALDILRLGAYQVLGDRVPVHAAVSTSVDLARERAARTSGFVNAVLRAVDRHDLDGWTARLTRPGSRDELAFRHQHPAWVVEALQAALDDPARLTALLEADNAPPKVTLAALPGRSSVDELLADGAVPGRWTATAAVLPSGTPGSVPAVAQGRARVQDEGSQLVALALTCGELAPGVAALPWLDMCAGPGGKTAMLAAVAAQRGAVVLATEQHHHRSTLVASALAAADLDGAACAVQADARHGPWGPGAFGRVLLDAPCTGLGALRRRPEARWRRRPEDLTRLVPLQRELLNAGVDALAAGGLLAYVTCSPHTDETVGVVESVVATRDDVAVEPAPAVLAGVPDAARGPYVQLWPDRHGTDAMFLALLRRTADSP